MDAELAAAAGGGDRVAMGHTAGVHPGHPADMSRGRPTGYFRCRLDGGV